MVKNPNLPSNAGSSRRHRFDLWVGKIPEGGHGNPLQYSCLENSMDRGTWWVTLHRVEKSQLEMTELT